MAYLFAVGFFSILGQVVLLRELGVAFYGIELIYTLALGVWLLFGACGALIGRRVHNPSFAGINLLFLLFSIGLLLDVAFIRSVRLLFSNIPGAYLPLPSQMIALSAALLPIGLLLGLLFQWAAKAYMARGESLAVAYAIESLGGLAGGICATLFLKFGFQNFVIAVLCALFALGPSLLNFARTKSKWFYSVFAIVAALAAVLLWKAPVFDRLMTSWTHPNLLETKDSAYSRITVTLLDGQISVFENDALVSDTEGTRAEEFVHLAALQHPNPKSVLVLGGGIEGIVREVLMHSPWIVDYVDLNPALLEVVPRHLPPEIQQSLRAGAGKVRIIVEDPRQFLSRAAGYDLILVGMPEPSSGQANRYYTREFFQQCHGRLNPQGILSFRLQSSENLWTPQLMRRMVSIYRAVKSAFPEVVFIPGSTNVVIGSTEKLTRDPLILASRLEARRIKARLVSPNYLRYLYANDRFPEVAGVLQSGTAPINTDVRPICYQYTLMIWLSKFLPAMKIRDFSIINFSLGRIAVWLFSFIMGALLLRFVRWPVRRTIVAGVAAFIGMVLETTLLLHFQIKNGILYQDIGILLTSFMAGLALGALAVAKLSRPLSKTIGVMMLVGFVLLGAATGWEISSGRNTGILETSGLLALAGFFAAGVFAYAGLYAADDQADVIAPLYSADLIGGCIGSLLASLALAPLAGLAVSAYLMAPAAMLAILLL
jgi:spermidine synthase